VSDPRPQRAKGRIAAAAAPLGIICGSGMFPIAVAKAVQARGRKVALFPIRGFAEPAVERFPHQWIDLGAFGRLIRIIKAAGCDEVVLVGGLVRPRLRHLRFDLVTLRMLPRLALLYRGGDDKLLSGIAAAFEEQGVRVRGAHEAAPELLMPEGVAGSFAPSRQDQDDIRFGFTLVHALGPFDVGQAVVVADNRVLAIEAAEGTAGMLARIAVLRESGRLKLPTRAGVLIKAPKPGQDRRIDLPAIGPVTVAEAKAAGLVGIAVEAGGTLVADPVALARAADEAGLFLFGVRAPGKRRR
jgi:DUF1009 family protein